MGGRCRVGLAIGGAGKPRFGRSCGAITNVPEMSLAGALRGADGQNVAARGDAACSLWMAGLDPRPTALSAPAT